MIKRVSIILFVCVTAVLLASSVGAAERFRLTRQRSYPQVPPNSVYSASQGGPAFNQSWGQSYNTQDWNRFYHYPYIYYPQNYWPQEYYRSADDLYNRYPPEMRIPVYNKKNYNYYKEPKPYRKGFHDTMDVF